MKVLYNTTYGGFKLSDEFCRIFKERYGEEIDQYMGFWDTMRADPRVVELFEERSEKEQYIAIKVIPDGCDWGIHEYDGKETVGWELPKSVMLEDLRKGYLGQLEKKDMNPLTQQWLDSGKSFDDFFEDFHKTFTHRDHA